MKRRWNGWGDSAYEHPISSTAVKYLAEQLGLLTSQPDITRSQAVASVPGSRLANMTGLDTSAETRLDHARGQSLPDWVNLRSGQISTFPDAVAFPQTSADVRQCIKQAKIHGWKLIPYGGGTSVTGHINPPASDTPVVTINLRAMNKLIDLDETSHLATFEAGVSGPELEQVLAPRGYTLGHFPQSFELSTLGGWIATRSSGQQSYYYGRIENLFAGGELETPLGLLELPVFPASAAGPDLRHIVLGSEGRLGILTQAVVRVRPHPEAEGFFGVFFHDWSEATNAVRVIAQSDLKLSMLRLSNSQETATTLILAGHERLINAADKGLRWMGYADLRCLLIFGVTGSARQVRYTRRAVESICRHWGGLPAGSLPGKTWKKSRFRTPYLRNTLWENGVAIDTLETALPWAKLPAAKEVILNSIRQAASAFGEKTLVFAHLSHLYADGASLYVTYLFRRQADPEKTISLWAAMKNAASQQIVSHQGTISHQHGVGLDHAQFLPAEKGEIGMKWISAVCQTVDPQGLMNPGKLIMTQPKEAHHDFLG
jgi:alkyldihydroxyacetonephosphate synthase